MQTHTSSREGLVSGLVLGVIIAFGFALLIRLIPESLLVETSSRALLYAVQLPAALIFVPIARGVARIRRESPRLVLLWACVGALAFDGLALGFWSSLYGQEGTCSRRHRRAAAVGVCVDHGRCAARGP